MKIVNILLWGVLAFVVTYILLLIVAAVFEAVGLTQVQAVIERFAWLISLLVGIAYGLSAADKPLLR